MKIKINKAIMETIEVPKYFQKNSRFCKVLNNEYYMKVNPQELDTQLDLVPSIQVLPVSYYLNDGNFNEITKEEFDLAFLKAESILNRLRKL